MLTITGSGDDFLKRVYDDDGPAGMWLRKRVDR